MAGKVINDPVHGHISLPDYCISVIDTPQFQRLRDLKQVGAAYLVFPGASHNRFEHSLGVCHLAGTLLEQIRDNQPELEITELDLKRVRLAGLCHDLGHGPFSHSFEGWASKVSKQQGHKEWEHEEMSQKLFRFLVKENNIDLEEEDIRFIIDLIGGKSSKPEVDEDKRFLYDIVANARNSVDVDKLDYLARDCYNMDFKSSYDFSRLLKFCRVINQEICFHSKEVYNLYELFHTRYSLFKQVYTHRVNKAIEYMLDDALTLSDPYLKISEKIQDPARFYLLTDSLLNHIESSNIPEMKAAQNIVTRIRKRELYKLATDVIIPSADETGIYQNITGALLIQFKHEKSPLREDHIRIHHLTLNYAMKDKNPMDNVHFFSTNGDSKSFSIPKERVSLLIPDDFSERYIRVYCTEPDMVIDLQHAFHKYTESISFNYPIEGTIEARKSLPSQ